MRPVVEQAHAGARFGIGVDIGTSGCRAIVVGAQGKRLTEAQMPLPEPIRGINGAVEQAPELWWDAVLALLARVAPAVAGRPGGRLCLDATSATLLLARPDGTPLGPALMYSDSQSVDAARRIASVAPATSAARGASSSLAKLLRLMSQYRPSEPVLALHQADWIIGRLAGRLTGSPAWRLTGRPASRPRAQSADSGADVVSGLGDSDWNNALKLGFDPASEAWPSWVLALLPAPVMLPEIHAPGASLAAIDRRIAEATGLPGDLMICAGTTDSTAAVIATGANRLGDAVTSLGSSLVLKIVSERPVAAPDYGVYSHRLGERWLAGGASNSGGAVLRKWFSPEQIERLMPQIDPNTDSGLDYYPLLTAGERFPIADPELKPRLTPRPPSDAHFLHGLLEGIARIERDGYRRLTKLGATAPRRVLTTGGGARNRQWQQMRQRLLGIPVLAAEHQDAAFGAAMLALHPAGWRTP
jgi:sugar (pentulose or hexulose) kinase